MNYENQIKVEIKNFHTITHKEGTKEAFIQPIDWQYIDEAAQKLSGNAFKLWFYLLKWAGKKEYQFSPAHLQKALNIKSKNTIYSIKEELIRERYLVQISEHLMYFYPCGHANLIYQKINC